MISRLRFFVLLVCFAAFDVMVSTAAAPLPFAQEDSDLAPDSAARFGTLPNGVRYVIRPNAEPKGRASLRLVVLAGSFMENENQRGLAHFLEHMAFNGSTHYPAGTLVEFFQRMGMNFGGDTNAYTSFDHTAYMLELPDTKDATLNEGWGVLADFAGGMLLAEPEIDRERGVILSEKRTRDSVPFRTMVAGMDFSLAGTIVPQRLPIGQEEIIQRAQRPVFSDLYNAWYRPERLIVVAVGDFNAETVEKQIAAAFSSLAARALVRAEPDLGRINTVEGLQVRFHPEPEAAATNVALSSVTPYIHTSDTAERRRRELTRSLAVLMLNRRLSILAKQEGAPILGAAAAIEEEFDLYRDASISATGRPDQWRAALALIEQELRRALEHGFQTSELREAVANVRNSLDQQVRTAATQRSGEIATTIIQSLVNRTVFTAPETERAVLTPTLDKVTPADCTAALRESWSAPGRFLFVDGNTKIDGDASAALTAAYTASQQVAVAAPASQVDEAFAYTDFGPAGRVVSRQQVADLDLTLVEFANGVRLNLKKTAFEANHIQVKARIGSGQLAEPREQPGLSLLAGAILPAGGLGRHSADDLERILAGKTLGLQFGVVGDALQFGGATNQDDLFLQLCYLAAYVTDPGYRPEAMRQVRKSIEQFYTGLEHSVVGPLQTEARRLLACGDPRFGVPSRVMLEGRTVEEVKTWLAPQLAHGPLEISLAGDLDVNATIDAVARTFGALPKRDAKPAFTAERKVDFPTAPLARNYQVETKIPKGIVAIYWPTTDASEARRTRQLSLLAGILSDRLRVKVRQELGGAYSPNAKSEPSDTYTGYGYLSTEVTVEPARAAEIEKAVKAIAADLAAHGVTEDELLRVKQPLLTSIHESSRTNGYWLNSVLLRAQEKPEVLEWSRTRESDFAGATKADLDALAARYLDPARASAFTVVPK